MSVKGSPLLQILIWLLSDDDFPCQRESSSLDTVKPTLMNSFAVLLWYFAQAHTHFIYQRVKRKE